MNIELLKELIKAEFNRNEDNLSKILDEVLRVVDLYDNSNKQQIEKIAEPIDWDKFKKEWVKSEPISDIDPCSGCSNNPKNGGSGRCNCTIPYMNRYYYSTPFEVTCQYSNK